MNFLRELFYLRKSDRKVIITLLCVIAIAFGVIFLTGSDGESNELTPADTLQKEARLEQNKESNTETRREQAAGRENGEAKQNE